jgi:tRNA pseudouridine65 synthase
MIPILYQDEQLAVVNKKHGLLMHASFIALDAEENLKDLLEEQLGKKVFLVHRLDRKTAGAVIVAFDTLTANQLCIDFADKKVDKTYWAICRGHLKDEILVEKALENENGNFQDAETFFKPLAWTELDIITGKYQKTRLSLVECKPKTGRMHQIRRHLAHLRHYIINDKPHGDCKVNKVFKEQLNIEQMMLHAKAIVFQHPKTNQNIRIDAPFFEQFEQLLLHFNN